MVDYPRLQSHYNVRRLLSHTKLLSIITVRDISLPNFANHTTSMLLIDTVVALRKEQARVNGRPKVITLVPLRA